MKNSTIKAALMMAIASGDHDVHLPRGIGMNAATIGEHQQDHQGREDLE